MHNTIFLEPCLQLRHDYTRKLSDLQAAKALSYYCIKEEYRGGELNLDYRWLSLTYPRMCKLKIEWKIYIFGALYQLWHTKMIWNSPEIHPGPVSWGKSLILTCLSLLWFLPNRISLYIWQIADLYVALGLTGGLLDF